MDASLVLISKLCSEVLHEDSITINQLCPVSDLYDNIETLVGRWCVDKVTPYWRFSDDRFVKIHNYISYAAAVSLMADKKIYLLLRDFEEPWIDNGNYLEQLDKLEMKQEAERNRDIYDVKISRPGDPVDDDPMLIVETEPDVQRTDDEVMAYSLRKRPQAHCYVADCLNTQQLIRDVIQGIPKERRKLTPPADEVIERLGAKKVKDDKKDKNDKKDKKKK